MRRHSWERISWIMKIPSRIPQISLWRKCSTSQKNWRANRKRLVTWTKFIEKIIHGNSCHWLVTRPLSIFNAQKSLRLLRLCVVSWKGPSTSGIQRSLEEKDWMDRHWQKLQRLWRNQWRADWIRVEHLPRIHYVAALRKSHRSTEQIRRSTRNFHRKNSLYVNFQRHFLWQKRQ